MKIATTIFFLVTATTAFAQIGGDWQEIDTVTAGDFDDYNPQIDDGGLGSGMASAPFEWIIFERWDGEQSSICGMKVKPFTNTSPFFVQWDSSATTISSVTANVLRKNPDICSEFETFDQSSIDSTVSTTVAAWQEKTDSLWNIYYSYTSGDETQWSTPRRLTTELADEENVKIRSLTDSSFIFIWKAGNVLMFTTFCNGIVASPDTLIVTNYDSTEFDCENWSYPPPTIAWTGKDSTGKIVCFAAQVTSQSPVVLSQLDTLNSDGNVSKPEFLGLYPQTMTMNVENEGISKPVLASRCWIYQNGPWQQVNLLVDTSSDNLNATGLVFGLDILPLSVFGLLVWEHRSSSDTTVVFGQLSDTIRTTGYNRNPDMSTYFLSNYTGISAVCVWESNRTGRSHIYGRVARIGFGAVQSPPHSDQTFVLQQNYPNPFNPTTTVRYQLPTISRVTLRVYDVLGRLVETLVDNKQTPGEHSAVFDATRLPSGVYFYRLSTHGNDGRFFVSTKKMILLK